MFSFLRLEVRKETKKAKENQFFLVLLILGSFWKAVTLVSYFSSLVLGAIAKTESWVDYLKARPQNLNTTTSTSMLSVSLHLAIFKNTRFCINILKLLAS